MDRVFLDIEYGKRLLSKDNRIKTCDVFRLNKHTNKQKRVKLYYIEVMSLQDLQDFCLTYDILEFALKYQELQIDAESFDLSLLVTRCKRSKRSTTVPMADVA